MWLVITLLAAVFVTALWYFSESGNRLEILGFMLWGATTMIFIDHTLGYLAEGGEFLEVTPEAMVLGVILVAVAFAVWEILLLLEDPKGKLKKKLDKGV